MDQLEVLNTAMEKQEHGQTVPMSLKIGLGGGWHTISIDRKDKNIQRLVRTLVMIMLRNEIDKTQERVNVGKAALENSRDVENATLKGYTIKVITGYDPGGYVPCGGVNTEGPTFEEVTVRAHSERDACVMAFILKADFPKDASSTHILAWAERDTEVVR
jgi:hypothetical protein